MVSKFTLGLKHPVQEDILREYPLGGVGCLGGRGRNYGGVTFSINWRPPLGEKQSRLETSQTTREGDRDGSLACAKSHVGFGNTGLG